MSNKHLPSAPEPDDEQQPPEVRLELTRAGVQEVLSLYSEHRSNREEPAFALRFEDFQRAFRERRRMLAWGVIAGLVGACLVLLLSTPLYPVTAQVVLEKHDVVSRGAGESDRPTGSAFIATQAEIMQSHSVIERAVRSIPRAAHLPADADLDDQIGDALAAVRASPVSGTQVVALGYLGADANFGIQLLTAIVDAYRAVLGANEAEAQDQKLAAKRAEIEVLDAESADLEARLERLRRDKQTLGSAEATAAAQSQVLRELTDQLTQVRNQRIALENRLAAGGEQLAIQDPATRSLQEQLWQAEAELARVRLSLTPQHPAVEAAQREVSVLRNQLRASSKATPEALKRDIEAARGLELSLLEIHAQERERMTQIEADRREEEGLIADLEQVRTMRDDQARALLDQRLLRRLAESGETGVTARMIEAPRLPERAAWPRPGFILALGLLLGLMGGFVAALVSLRREVTAWEASSERTRAGIEVQ